MYYFLNIILYKLASPIDYTCMNQYSICDMVGISLMSNVLPTKYYF